MRQSQLGGLIIGFKSAGEIASGIAHRLYRSNFQNILMVESPTPLAVRRKVSFCEAVHDGCADVEGIRAVLCRTGEDVRAAWADGNIAVAVDPSWDLLSAMSPDVVIDAIIAKRNLGTRRDDAPLTIGLGPGFRAGEDVDIVIETNRGHNIGRLIRTGEAAPNTGIPGTIAGVDKDRVFRAPAPGTFISESSLGDIVTKGEVLGHIRVNGNGSRADVVAGTSGVIRGLIRDGFDVREGLKLGDIDPRGDISYLHTISDKARALGGSVLEAVLSRFNG